MSVIATEVFDADGGEEPLKRLGLSREGLNRVIMRALDAALSCNENDPITMAGTMLWGKGIRFFAEEYRPFGWKRINPDNQGIILSPDGFIGVTAASGDEDTGIANGSPCTRSKKGRTTVAACRDNRQGSFADWLDPLPAIASTRVPGRSTWFLLMHRNRKRNVLQAELSLPTSMDDDGYIVSWDKRILLAEVTFDSIPTHHQNEDGGGNAESPEVTVQITRLG